MATLACGMMGLAHGQAADAAKSVMPTRANLPPVEDFLRKPKYDSLELSPDGKLLAAIAPVNGRRNLVLIDVVKRNITVLTNLKEQDVYTFRWIGDATLEVAVADLTVEGRLLELKQDVLVDITGRVIRDRPPRVLSVLDRAGDDLLVSGHDRSSRSLDVWRYNPRTNERQLLTSDSPGDVVGYVVDRAGQVRLAVSIPRGGERTRLYYRASNDAKWTLLRDDMAEDDSIRPIAFGFDNKTLYVRARGTDNNGLFDIYVFDPETNQLGEKISDTRGVDAGNLVFDWVKKAPVGMPDGSGNAVHWTDPEWKALQASIDKALPDTRNRLSWGRYEPSRVLVTTDSPTQPPVWYLLDRSNGRMEEVASAYPWLKESQLSPRTFVRYKARDGLSIPAFLTMPKVPDGAKPPLIVVVHGGPFIARQAYGFDRDAQLFASRGYAVLQPDFRGTRGYGDAFYKAGWKQWGLAMQDDVTDGVKWLIDSGKVDADRVCLFGASYGGYATLWGLEKEPQMFRCGVAQVAVADLELMFDVGWSDFMEGERDGDQTKTLARWIGDPSTDRAKMRAASPILHADRIQAPLLLAYGASDRRVPIVHGKAMRSALDKYDKPYEWVVYNDEGHGFTKEENNVDFYRRVDAFFAKNLVPRASPTTTAAATKAQ
jgi:dipeptidyl aminopeptidase/acylaminoacyl peptidase